MKTPLSLAIFSSTSLVPSPLYSCPSGKLSSRLIHLSPAPAPPLTVSPRSTAASKYSANSSLPSAERLPTAEPKELPLGYPPMKASGSSRRSTECEAARWASVERRAKVWDVEDCVDGEAVPRRIEGIVTGLQEIYRDGSAMFGKGTGRDLKSAAEKRRRGGFVIGGIRFECSKSYPASGATDIW